MEIVAGIDVGGTFTDVLLYHTVTGELRLAKVFSTPGRQANGLLTGLRQFGVPLGELDAVVHGTTVATNAVLERKGSRTALVTTRGFRDVLELRRRDRPTTYGLTGTYRPLVPRSLSFEVDERIDARGQVVEPLDPASVQKVAAQLRQSQVESVAVCLLNSYVNADHERSLAQDLRRLLPSVEVTASYEVCPEPGEFERATTTVVNAFVRAPMSQYLGAVQQRLEDEGFDRDVQVMQSNGGLIPARRGGELAVRTLLSGPAAGTVAAASFGEAAGLTDVISCDMGGTSFDVPPADGFSAARTSVVLSPATSTPATCTDPTTARAKDDDLGRIGPSQRHDGHRAERTPSTLLSRSRRDDDVDGPHPFTSSASVRQRNPRKAAQSDQLDDASSLSVSFA